MIPSIITVSGYGAVDQRSSESNDEDTETSQISFGAMIDQSIISEPNNDDTETTQISSFQEGDIYYLKERTLTAQESFRKLTLLAVPLIPAVLIIGGAAWLFMSSLVRCILAQQEATRSHRNLVVHLHRHL
jgi:hypothetical protein